jgi:hypothetical protein
MPTAMAETATPVNNWCLVEWTDAERHVVKRLACHFEELAEVLDLPWPAKAACREPVTEYTGLPTYITWFRRRPSPRLGDTFVEFINQGDRDCWVIAVEDETGRYLYEYEMPNGRIFLRNQDGKPVARNTLSAKWRALIAEGGLSEYSSATEM